jgi:Hsp20/alpha crystallin family
LIACSKSWLTAVSVVGNRRRARKRQSGPARGHPRDQPEEVKIEVEDDILTVSGEHEEHKEQKDKHYVRRERRYGSLSRSMALPPGVEAKNIKAKTHDGVVEVTIPLPKEGKKEAVTITPTAA